MFSEQIDYTSLLGANILTYASLQTIACPWGGGGGYNQRCPQQQSISVYLMQFLIDRQPYNKLKICSNQQLNVHETMQKLKTSIEENCKHCFFMNKCTSIENDIRQFKHILPKYTNIFCRLGLFFTSYSLRIIFFGFIPLTLIFSFKLFYLAATYGKC